MAVTPKISTGIILQCDRTGGSTFENINATVDFNFSQSAPRQDKTKQLTITGASPTGRYGIREFLPGLRTRELSFSLRYDQVADATASTVSHAELFSDFLSGVKGNWKVTYPPTGGTINAPTYTGARTRTFKGVMTSFRVRGGLGQVVTADVTLQICGTVTEA